MNLTTRDRPRSLGVRQEDRRAPGSSRWLSPDGWKGARFVFPRPSSYFFLRSTGGAYLSDSEGFSTLAGAWSWRRSLLQSDLPSTTKHVLLTLSCHVPEIGGTAFPSPATLAEECSLFVDTVKKHLRLGVDEGWIAKRPRFTDNGRQTTSEYVLRGGGGSEEPPSVANARGRGVANTPPEGGRKHPPHILKSSEEKLRGERGAPAIEGELFSENGNGVDPVALAVGEFCQRTGAEWKLKKGIAEWVGEIKREPRYAGVDFRYEIVRCAEWHEGKGKTPSAPDRSIRNWLERAAEDAREEERKNGSADPSWVTELELG